MKVLAIGASRNIGSATSLNLLRQGHRVAFVLRNPSTFVDNAEIKPFIESGFVQLIKGDALDVNSLRAAWIEAGSSGGPVDVAIFSVGGGAGQRPFALKGVVLDPPNLCTTALLNTFSSYPHDSSSTSQPRFVIITSNGVTKETHAALPVWPMYAMLEGPHADKIDMEKIVHHSAGWTSPWVEDGPKEKILQAGWESNMPDRGWLKHVSIVRPAVLTNGKMKGKYRVGEKPCGAFTISRLDVAHFIANDVIPNWADTTGEPYH
ncbi:hypothetical protein FRB94_005640 [Tulasnella sp. JGI-2019a]|nr:hypothetical protein FRB93_005284 [Tulasnella sp. JGI-2019a]KAG9000196.1 hypothetical protein FRB94_005640 [Tulasnella sp. JGI-2019a]